MAEQQQLEQREFNTLKMALNTYRNSAPDRGAIDGDPLLSGQEVEALSSKLKGLVKKDGDDADAKAKKAQQDYDKQAKFGMARDAMQQKERQFSQDPDSVSPENPGPGANAMITEKAKEQGMSRKGQEPDAAHGPQK
jgi:hypothetical protein